MIVPGLIAIFLLQNCFLVQCVYFDHHNGLEDTDDFSSEWIVRVPGGREDAELIAVQLNYAFGGEVQWAEQLFSKKREKRDFIFPENPHNGPRFNKIFPKYHIEALQNDSEVLEVDKLLLRAKRGDLRIPEQNDVFFNDELWSQEWYLHDTRTMEDLPKLDLNVLPVYKMGITGKNIRVTILDDGIEYLHDDLKSNYDPEISWDCNGNDADPIPQYYEKIQRNAHGTRCAGEVAMTANNGKCGVGIAFGAKIGGIRMLDGKVDDRVEATALGFAYDKVDIYSSSWGPSDDGKTVEGPGRLAQEAMERGITKGRNGNGVIYVWANGNGGSRGDNCNCDGYIASIYTVAIGSASQQGFFPWYGEPCAATLAVTYSSGAYEDQMIATTDLNNKCTIKHTGTSAAAPLAAGMIALALEANNNLTWRDVQHLIIWTSEYSPVADNNNWIVNGAGFRFNVKFGFGLMNGHSLVLSAIDFVTVPQKSICKTQIYEENNLISYLKPFKTEIFTTGCMNTSDQVNFLEHIELVVNINYSIRGSLEIFLTSPLGTRIPLLNTRKFDRSQRGLKNWVLMSVGTWGEVPRGNWILEIVDKRGPVDNIGEVGYITLIQHGTKEKPDYLKNGPRVYNDEYSAKIPVYTDIDSNELRELDDIEDDDDNNFNTIMDDIDYKILFRFNHRYNDDAVYETNK